MKKNVVASGCSQIFTAVYDVIHGFKIGYIQLLYFSKCNNGLNYMLNKFLVIS